MFLLNWSFRARKLMKTTNLITKHRNPSHLSFTASTLNEFHAMFFTLWKSENLLQVRFTGAPHCILCMANAGRDMQVQVFVENFANVKSERAPENNKNGIPWGWGYEQRITVTKFECTYALRLTSSWLTTLLFRLLLKLYNNNRFDWFACEHNFNIGCEVVKVKSDSAE